MATPTSPSADSILAAYLQQQQKQLNKSKPQQQQTGAATKHKSAYKLTFKQTDNKQQHLDCTNLINSPPPSGHYRHQQGQRFFSIGQSNHNQSFNSPTRTLDGNNRHCNGEASNGDTSSANCSTIVHIQRKLLAFFYIYATIIISLYLTYAIYCYYQQNQFKRQQQELMMMQASRQQAMISSASTLIDDSEHNSGNGNFDTGSSASSSSSSQSQQQQQQQQQEFQAKLENKIHLLERYIEVLAVDLEATKTRLSEREKCACSIKCSFNGTNYSDGQVWQQKCDICSCRAGKITCQPRECPKPKCAQDKDAIVQLLPGQCCPTCMKKCKVNKTLVKHGDIYKPIDSNGVQTKQCKCNDGMMKCEPLASYKHRPRSNSDNSENSTTKRQAASQYVNQHQYLVAPTKNKTIEYLKSILGSEFNPPPPTPKQPPPTPTAGISSD